MVQPKAISLRERTFSRPQGDESLGARASRPHSTRNGIPLSGPLRNARHKKLGGRDARAPSEEPNDYFAGQLLKDESREVMKVGLREGFPHSSS